MRKQARLQRVKVDGDEILIGDPRFPPDKQRAPVSSKPKRNVYVLSMNRNGIILDGYIVVEFGPFFSKLEQTRAADRLLKDFKAMGILMKIPMTQT